MPPEAPLKMPAQDLSRPFRDGNAAGQVRPRFLVRCFVFGLAGLLTFGLALVFEDWFMLDGISTIEGAMIGLVIFTFFWIALSVVTAVLGLLPRAEPKFEPTGAMDVALLMPIFGEPAAEVFDRLRVMADDLKRVDTSHKFSIFVLSDTRDPDKIANENAAFSHLQATLPAVNVYYRNRLENTGFKSGNIADWVSRWGGAYDGMLVLDADSVMSGQAIVTLTDALQDDPAAGLVQSIPRLYGARTLFARLQQFANTVYGPALARGLACWSGDDANFWGHNAIIRTKAFAASAGLPELKGKPPFGGPILSHDFVEAALLRRAGWRVKFLPHVVDTYEATPPNLVAHILRDRRWCQGNLQHLRLLATAGFSPVSRMHMFQGAMAYVVSVGWFSLLILWVVLGATEPKEFTYFSTENPFSPVWPQMDLIAKALVLGLVYGLLIAPKLIGAFRFWWIDPRLESAGGIVRFWASWLLEVFWSILLAPSMMIQHIIAVLRTLFGVNTGWKPGSVAKVRARDVMRFHAPEVVLGVAMFALFGTGLLSFWLLPIALCLLLAPLFSGVTATAPAWIMAVLMTPQETGPPQVLSELINTGRPHRASGTKPSVAVSATV